MGKKAKKLRREKIGERGGEKGGGGGEKLTAAREAGSLNFLLINAGAPTQGCPSTRASDREEPRLVVACNPGAPVVARALARTRHSHARDIRMHPTFARTRHSHTREIRRLPGVVHSPSSPLSGL